MVVGIWLAGIFIRNGGALKIMECHLNVNVLSKSHHNFLMLCVICIYFRRKYAPSQPISLSTSINRRQTKKKSPQQRSTQCSILEIFQ